MSRAIISFTLVIGVLAMLWPLVFGLFLGVLWVLGASISEPEVTVWSWSEESRIPF